MRPTSVGKSGIDEGHRIVQTCNLTYCPDGDFRHDWRRFALAGAAGVSWVLRGDQSARKSVSGLQKEISAPDGCKNSGA